MPSRHSPAHAEPSARSGAGSSRQSLITAVLCIAGTVVALQQTLVVPAIPRLPGILGASPSSVSWAVTATLLAGAASTPIVSRLADMVGKKRMMLISIAFVLVGSLLAPLGGLPTIILGRAGGRPDRPTGPGSARGLAEELEQLGVAPRVRDRERVDEGLGVRPQLGAELVHPRDDTLGLRLVQASVLEEPRPVGLDRREHVEVADEVEHRSSVRVLAPVDRGDEGLEDDAVDGCRGESGGKLVDEIADEDCSAAIPVRGVHAASLVVADDRISQSLEQRHEQERSEFQTIMN